MRLILSRKGFDSSAGGCPSPVFPDGSWLALPIPDKRSGITYRQISHPTGSVGDLVRDLTDGRLAGNDGAHLDPDLDVTSLPRQPGWRPLLGQTGSAQGHLRNEGVREGDLFLFFGLFREVTRASGHWRFCPGSRPFHALWGWMQIDGVYTLDALGQPVWPWATYHPHCHGEPDPRNTLYVGRERLSLPGLETIPGAGIFPHYHSRYRLTAPEARLPTQWRLDAGFFPKKGRKALSYHRNLDRWQLTDQGCDLRCAARGQEFVLDLDQYEALKPWVQRLLTP